MKYIVFSFDDGRKDTYTIAKPILNEKCLPATVNITSDFMAHPQAYADKFVPAEAMSKEDVLTLQQSGFEIACHGHTHQNTAQDILQNIRQLHDWGVETRNIGFASPHSALTEQLPQEIQALLDNGTLAYIRSGDQVRREGLVYTFKYVLQYYLKSPLLFWQINKRHLYPKERFGQFVRGISVTRNTTFKQIKTLIEKMPDESVAVLIFHSIFLMNDAPDKKDKWFWDKSDFQKLCTYIAGQENITVKTHKQILEESQCTK